MRRRTRSLTSYQTGSRVAPGHRAPHQEARDCDTGYACMTDQPKPEAPKPTVPNKDRSLLAQMAAAIAARCSMQNEALAVETSVRMARMILDKIDQGA